ncbi:hypothetical protein BRO54_3432 [Geobacillus proteiniphilus]|nr:hypothetical protein BRO54_3432 [Geobacillus proteiniphilus]
MFHKRIALLSVVVVSMTPFYQKKGDSSIFGAKKWRLIPTRIRVLGQPHESEPFSYIE